MNIADEVKLAKNRSVPLVQIVTPDQLETIACITGGLNGNADSYPLVCWDICNGYRGLNKLGQLAIIAALSSPQEAEQAAKSDAVFATKWEDINKPGPKSIAARTSKPSDALMIAQGLPQRSILFFCNAQRYLDPKVQGSAAVAQAILNLRNPFKEPTRIWNISGEAGKKPEAGSRLLVMLVPDLEQLPVELRQDILVIEENLPDEDARKKIIVEIYEGAGFKQPEEKLLQTALDATRGMSTFSLEQEVSLSLVRTGLDIKRLEQRAVRTINMQPGLSVGDWPILFDRDIGGNENLKKFLRRILDKGKPGPILFVDEIEKGLSGAGSSMSGGMGDTSGTSQGMHGELLKWIVDKDVFCVLFVGVGGTGKSIFAKAAGNYAGVKTVNFELQAMKGSLVGQSVNNLRNACRTIDAFSARPPMLFATTNSPDDISPEMLSRFAIIFFFDLPVSEELKVIWDIHIKAKGINSKQELPNDEGWVGRDIFNCVRNAEKMDIPLVEAAKLITPASKTSASVIEQLRMMASSRAYISTSYEGPYKVGGPAKQPVVPTVPVPKARRSIEGLGDKS